MPPDVVGGAVVAAANGRVEVALALARRAFARARARRALVRAAARRVLGAGVRRRAPRRNAPSGAASGGSGGTGVSVEHREPGPAVAARPRRARRRPGRSRASPSAASRSMRGRVAAVGRHGELRRVPVAHALPRERDREPHRAEPEDDRQRARAPRRSTRSALAAVRSSTFGELVFAGVARGRLVDRRRTELLVRAHRRRRRIAVELELRGEPVLALR